MKGVVFLILEKFIDKNLGDEAWEDLLDEADLASGGAFAATATYPDEELFSIVTLACEKNNLDINAIVKSFGEFMFPFLAEKYPDFVNSQDNLKDFLLTIDDVIHVEVKKLYPEAGLPKIQYKQPNDKTLIMVYDSPRKLCFLAEGLIQGAASHFGEAIEISQSLCAHRGDKSCHINIAFK